MRPPIPVVETIPPVTAKPKAWVSLSKSAQVAPPCAVARRRGGSTVTVFISERSMTTPPSVVENPAMLCPPPRTATVSPWLRANSTAFITSAVPAQRMINAGCLSWAAFQTARAPS